MSQMSPQECDVNILYPYDVYLSYHTVYMYIYIYMSNLLP